LGIRIDDPHTATQLVLFMMLLSFVDGAGAPDAKRANVIPIAIVDRDR
jgi:hypothetical protein